MQHATSARSNIEQLVALHGRRAPGNSNTTGYDAVAQRDVVYPGFFTREYMNFGYWYRNTLTRREASENLMEKVIAGIPDRTGTVLDVACGLGFTTRYLTERWCAGHVHGINISTCQLASCRRNSPRSRFSLMDASRLGFADESFDNVVCIEAAFHFDSRESFLREACRILKTRGVLTLTDLLLHREGHTVMQGWLPVNYVPSLAAYGTLVQRAGFSRVDVRDITEEGLKSYLRYMFSKVHDDWLAGVCDFASLHAALGILHKIAACHRWNVLCIASK